MLLIAVDTSGRKGSLALCRGDANSFETLQLISLEGGNYSAQLMPQISEALEHQGFSKTAVDAFVVVSGPGSFTGLRVGLATVKGLCEVLQKPLAAVSMLEALAITYGPPGHTVTTLLDAGRGEMYVGQYEVSANGATMLRESIVKEADFAVDPASKGHVLTPEPATADFLKAHDLAAITTVSPLTADHIALIGLRKIVAGDLADPATVDVNYIRRSDAELFPPRR